jgi:hypothetical protein
LNFIEFKICQTISTRRNSLLINRIEEKGVRGMRLIRTLLVLSGAGILLPSPPENISDRGMAADDQVSTLQMLSSASSAVSDVAGFCGRQPEVCETAAFIAGKLEAKAKYSVRLIYEWASESSSDPTVPAGTQEAVKVDLLPTGTTLAEGVPVADEVVSQSTLGIEDLIPEWRGPVKTEKPKAAAKKEG